LPAATFAKLRQMGVTTAFDLRSIRENARRPSPLLLQTGIHIATLAHDILSGDLAAILDALGVHCDDVLEDPIQSNAARDQLLRRDQDTYLGEIAPALVEPPIAADESCLAGMFDGLDAEHGGSHCFAARHRGLDGAR
jgi:hypothetical protein